MTWQRIEEADYGNNSGSPQSKHAEIEPQLVGCVRGLPEPRDEYDVLGELIAEALRRRAEERRDKTAYRSDCGWDQIFKNEVGTGTSKLPSIIGKGDAGNPKTSRTDGGELPPIHKKPYTDCGWGRLIDYMKRHEHEQIGREKLGSTAGEAVGRSAAEVLFGKRGDKNPE